MGRRRTDRWIAVCGGVLVNGLILGALGLIEEAAPVVEEQRTLLVELEQPEKQKPPPKQAPVMSGSPSAAVPASPDRSMISAGSPATTQPAPNPPPAPAIDPQWRMDQRTIDRLKITEGVPEWGWGRYYRACQGLSSEHLTDEEKDKCYGAWDGRKDKRPSPAFIGPIDETKWETPEPKVAPDAHEVRKQRCRDYRRGRTPGFSERNLPSTGSPPPSLREGGCF